MNNIKWYSDAAELPDDDHCPYLIEAEGFLLALAYREDGYWWTADSEEPLDNLRHVMKWSKIREF